jgi:hypothetical protein
MRVFYHVAVVVLLQAAGYDLGGCDAQQLDGEHLVAALTAQDQQRAVMRGAAGEVGSLVMRCGSHRRLHCHQQALHSPAQASQWSQAALMHRHQLLALSSRVLG